MGIPFPQIVKNGRATPCPFNSCELLNTGHRGNAFGEIHIDCALGLINIDKETFYLCLVHKSLQDYLTIQHEQYGLFEGGNNEIVNICLSYMSIELEYAISSFMLFANLLKNYSFLEYSFTSWGYHARKCSIQETELWWNAISKISHQESCIGYGLYLWVSRHIRWHFPSTLTRPNIINDSRCIPRYSPLNVFAYFGIAGDFVQDIVWNMSHDMINLRSIPDKYTALSLAVEYGHEEFVRVVLRSGDTDVNLKNGGWYSTPLTTAVSSGSETIIRLLLERGDIDVNLPDNFGVTPLMIAAEKVDQVIIARILLEKNDIDVNAEDNCGKTALVHAIEVGATKVVRLLLERSDIDVNRGGGYEYDIERDYKSPTLCFAAWDNRESITRMLLARPDVDINAPDEFGRTPLSLAAKWNQLSIVQLFLERSDIDVNRGAVVTDELYQEQPASQRSPLAIAAEEGNEAVVKALLDRPGVDVNMADGSGQTPLSLAVSNNRVEVVRLLLSHASIGINIGAYRDEYCIECQMSPLLIAASNGYDTIVRLLLERTDVEVNY